MLVWDAEKFDEYIDKAVKDGELDGQRIEGRMDVYNYLADKTVTKTNTVQRWREEGSPGPGKEKKVIVIEKIFGTSFRKEVNEDDSNNEKLDMSCKRGYSDYVKNQVKIVYDLIKQYLCSGHVPNEEIYHECLGRIYDFRVFIPESCFEEVVRFFKEYIAPIVREENKMKSSYEELIYTPINIIDKEHEKEIRKGYLEKEFELVAKFEMFAKVIFYPIIMS